MEMDATRRLVAYGTLRPGQSNHGQLAGLRGDWTPGTVRGRVIEVDWGGASGYPGIILDPNASEIDVEVFESDDLPEHWPRLDAFEGPGYRRALINVATDRGVIQGLVYELVPR